MQLAMVTGLLAPSPWTPYPRQGGPCTRVSAHVVADLENKVMSRSRQKILSKYPPDTCSRIVAFGFRSSPREALEIEQKAKGRGLTAGEYCRLAALSQTMPSSVAPALPEIDREALFELRKIGVNLNQAVTALHVANRQGEVLSPASLAEIVSTANLVRRAVFRLLGDEAIDSESEREIDQSPTTVEAIVDLEYSGDVPKGDASDSAASTADGNPPKIRRF